MSSDRENPDWDEGLSPDTEYPENAHEELEIENEHESQPGDLFEALAEIVNNEPEHGYVAREYHEVFLHFFPELQSAFAVAAADGYLEAKEFLGLLAGKMHDSGDIDDMFVSLQAVREAQALVVNSGMHDPDGLYVTGIAAALQKSYDSPEFQTEIRSRLDRENPLEEQPARHSITAPPIDRHKL